MPRIDVSFNGHLPNCVCNQCGLARLGAESIRNITRRSMKNFIKIRNAKNKFIAEIESN